MNILPSRPEAPMSWNNFTSRKTPYFVNILQYIKCDQIFLFIISSMLSSVYLRFQLLSSSPVLSFPAQFLITVHETYIYQSYRLFRAATARTCDASNGYACMSLPLAFPETFDHFKRSLFADSTVLFQSLRFHAQLVHLGLIAVCHQPALEHLRYSRDVRDRSSEQRLPCTILPTKASDRDPSASCTLPVPVLHRHSCIYTLRRAPLPSLACR